MKFENDASLGLIVVYQLAGRFVSLLIMSSSDSLAVSSTFDHVYLECCLHFRKWT